MEAAAKEEASPDAVVEARDTPDAKRQKFGEVCDSLIASLDETKGEINAVMEAVQAAKPLLLAGRVEEAIDVLTWMDEMNFIKHIRDDQDELGQLLTEWGKTRDTGTPETHMPEFAADEKAQDLSQ
eukprot:3075273-Prymnesium_polylepis.1